MPLTTRIAPFVLALTFLTQPLAAQESKGIEVSGSVVDAETGEQVQSFEVIPGYSMMDLMEDRIGSGMAPEDKLILLQHYKDEPINWGRSAGVKFDKGGPYTIFLTSQPLQSRRILIEADDYAPQASERIIGENGKATLDFKLIKAKPLTGHLLDPAGNPLPNTPVILLRGRTSVLLRESKFQPFMEKIPSAKTDENGEFSFPPQFGRFVLAAAHDSGFVMVMSDTFEKDSTLRLQAWGRIEGQLLKGTRPDPDQLVGVGYSSRESERDFWYLGGSIHDDAGAKSDAEGHFVIERVRPGRWTLGRSNQGHYNIASFHATNRVEVKPGETTRVTIGGTGRPVVGRILKPEPLATINWNEGDFKMVGQQKPGLIPPDRVETDDKGRVSTTVGIFTMTPEERDALPFTPTVDFWLEEDGSFRVEDVPPGNYKLELALNQPLYGRGGMVEALAKNSLEFTIPEERSDEPLDLGTIELKVVGQLKPPAADLYGGLKIGDAAPLFEAPTLDGRTFKLADHKGKYILVDFWATWCGPCIAEHPNLQSAWDKYGKDDRFVLVGVSIDKEIEKPRAYAAEKKVPWAQCHIGPSSRAAAEYGFRGIPYIILVGPDGKIIDNQMRGEHLMQVLERELGGPK